MHMDGHITCLRSVFNEENMMRVKTSYMNLSMYRPTCNRTDKTGCLKVKFCQANLAALKNGEVYIFLFLSNENAFTFHSLKESSSNQFLEEIIVLWYETRFS